MIPPRISAETLDAQTATFHRDFLHGNHESIIDELYSEQPKLRDWMKAQLEGFKQANTEIPKDFLSVAYMLAMTVLVITYKSTKAAYELQEMEEPVPK